VVEIVTENFHAGTTFAKKNVIKSTTSTAWNKMKIAKNAHPNVLKNVQLDVHIHAQDHVMIYRSRAKSVWFKSKRNVFAD
jgi:hypothetical protein